MLTGPRHLSTSTIAPVLITVLLAPGRYGQQNQQPGVAVFNFFHNEDVSPCPLPIKKTLATADRATCMLACTLWHEHACDGNGQYFES